MYSQSSLTQSKRKLREDTALCQLSSVIRQLLLASNSREVDEGVDDLDVGEQLGHARPDDGELQHRKQRVG